jgi:LAO/AO transport system kinase
MNEYISLQDIKKGGKTLLSRALSQIEKNPLSQESLSLLSEAYQNPLGLVIGITGPPGVGKSTLTASLIKQWRSKNNSVAVIAVDPSSKISGGALLGDRLRIDSNPDDPHIFIRSMAARHWLGGLAEMSLYAMVLMRAIFDIVLIETVGVGQSETDIAHVVDHVLLCIQPGSGDSIQFMKSGIVEIPDSIVVTKADLGEIAQRTFSNLKEALPPLSSRKIIPIHTVSARSQEGFETLLSTIHDHLNSLSLSDHRHKQVAQWLATIIRERFGQQGLKKIGPLILNKTESPFDHLGDISKKLSSSS